MFITFEGGDGSGKTTQVENSRAFLEQLGRPVFRTREPGGTPLGVKVREILLNTTGPVDPHAEALLFAADRAQHVRTAVVPNLERGIDVVQDRYIDSSVAYQSAGRGLDPDQVLDISTWASGGLVADLTILLDLDPEIAASRVERRGEADRMEAEKMEFKRALRAGFLRIAEQEPHRVAVVDASQALEQVTAQVKQLLQAAVVRRNAQG